MGIWDLKILIIGDAAVGKTSLVRKFITFKFSVDYKKTIGCDVYTKNIQIDDEIVTLLLWDIAGQKSWQSFRNIYYKGAHGAIVMFDLTRYNTFNPNIEHWIKELWDYTGLVPIILIGNKVDLIDLRDVRKKDPKKYSEAINCKYIETSAKTGENVDDAFHYITRKIINIDK